jgi:hypothetical protein
MKAGYQKQILISKPTVGLTRFFGFQKKVEPSCFWGPVYNGFTTFYFCKKSRLKKLFSKFFNPPPKNRWKNTRWKHRLKSALCHHSRALSRSTVFAAKHLFGFLDAAQTSKSLFATRCVESGIDIPTVACWLGHSGGWMLALKIYEHLRRAHSQSMASKVTFGAAMKPDNVTHIQREQAA